MKVSSNTEDHDPSLSEKITSPKDQDTSPSSEDNVQEEIYSRHSMREKT